MRTWRDLFIGRHLVRFSPRLERSSKRKDEYAYADHTNWQLCRPRPAHVHENLASLSSRRLQWLALCGSHDDVFYRFIIDPETSRNPGYTRSERDCIYASSETYQTVCASGVMFLSMRATKPAIPLEQQTERDPFLIWEPLTKGPELDFLVFHRNTSVEIFVLGHGWRGYDSAHLSF